MDWLSDPAIWSSLLTLTALEIVLGVDNVIFISILANKLPESQRARARSAGLGAALLMRILLLLSISQQVEGSNPSRPTQGNPRYGGDLCCLRCHDNSLTFGLCSKLCSKALQTASKSIGKRSSSVFAAALRFAADE